MREVCNTPASGDWLGARLRAGAIIRRLEHAGHRRRRGPAGVEAGCEFDINTAAPLTLYSTTLRD